MPIFIAALLGGLVSAAGSFVGRVLIALGIGFVSYTGVQASLGWIKEQVFASIASLPQGVIEIFGTLKIDVAINIIFSAYVARFVLQGLTGGTIKRMVQK